MRGDADDAVRAAALTLALEDANAACGALACLGGNLRAAGMPLCADQVDASWSAIVELRTYLREFRAEGSL